MSEQHQVDAEVAGRIAFDAYRESAGSLTYDGKPIPLWHELTDAVREHWRRAALAAITHHLAYEVLRR